MKKKHRFLSLMLSLCIAAALLPASAFAANENYGLWVNGIEVTPDNAENILGDGTASYNPDTTTLTLNGASLTTAYEQGALSSVIYANEEIDTLRIISENENSIAASAECGIYAYNALELGGSGKLSVNVTGDLEVYGAYSLLNGITISGGDYSFAGHSQFSYGIMVSYGYKVTVNGGSLIAVGDGDLGTAIHSAINVLDFSNFTGCTAVGNLNASGEPELEYSPDDAILYKYIKIEKPKPLEYDDNGFTEDKKHFEPALLQDGAYQITNAGNLFWFAQFLKEAEANGTADAQLTANITIPADMNWLPMEAGEYGTPYQGTFDGQGYAITGLKIRYGASDFYSGTGLFETLGQNGVIQNLGLINTDIEVAAGTVGSFCGSNNGIIQNCYNTGSVKGTADYSQLIGGIAGRNYGTIRLSYNTGEVSAESAIAGGICGDASGQAVIENCYNTGAVSAQWSVGGICGQLDSPASISNCYNTGSLTVSEGYQSFMHGIAASGNNPVAAQSNEITNSYYLNQASTEDGGRTQAQFKSGEIAYLLNGSTSQGKLIFGQTIGGANAQDAPVFGGATVYAGYEFCYSENISYGNDQNSLFASQPEHNITGEYQSNENGHWQICQNQGCSQQGQVIPHTPSSELINVSQPTASQEGYTGDTVCSICGYVMAYGQTIDKLAPSITQGDNVQYTPGETSQPPYFQSDASIDDFMRVLLDGQEIAGNNYTAEQNENGFRLAFNAEYLNTLPTGTHKIEMVFETGSVEADLTIQAQTQEPSGPDDNPGGTGDSGSLILILALILLGACIISLVIYKSKKQN